MKKFLACLLAGVMVFGLAACGNDNNTKNPGDEVKPKPQVVFTNLDASSQDVQMTQGEETISGKLVVSPLTRERFNPETTLEALKALDSIKDWKGFSYDTGEFANYNEADDGIITFTGYELNETLNIQQLENDWSTGNEFAVKYTTFTARCINYSEISVEFTYSDDKEHLTDDQLKEILVVVYGQEIGEFLHSGDMGEGSDYSPVRIANDYGEITLHRYENENSALYSVSCDPIGVNTSVLGYVGDYVHHEDKLNVIADFLHFAEDERDVHQYRTWGKSFFTKYFGEDTYLDPNTVCLYLWTTHDGVTMHGDNKSEHMSINLNLCHSETNEQNGGCLFSYNVENGKHMVSFVMIFGYTPKAELTDAYREEMRQLATDIVKDALQLEDATGCFDEGKTYKANVNGNEVDITCSFYWDESGEDAYPCLIISTP